MFKIKLKNIEEDDNIQKITRSLASDYYGNSVSFLKTVNYILVTKTQYNLITASSEYKALRTYHNQRTDKDALKIIKLID